MAENFSQRFRNLIQVFSDSENILLDLLGSSNIIMI